MGKGHVAPKFGQRGSEGINAIFEPGRIAMGSVMAGVASWGSGLLSCMSGVVSWVSGLVGLVSEFVDGMAGLVSWVCQLVGRA